MKYDEVSNTLSTIRVLKKNKKESIDMAIIACNKQIPHQPYQVRDGYVYEVKCDVCNSYQEISKAYTQCFCWRCGQLLKWGNGQ